jgi:hypothetical protein
MKFITDTQFKTVFRRWRQREETNPAWVDLATKVKGFATWQDWRMSYIEQMDIQQREWQIYEFSDVMKEVPLMLMGPYKGWQSRTSEKHSFSFRDLLVLPDQLQEFSNHSGILSILEKLPFTTEFIGVIRKDNNRIVCLDGHHRATAITLAEKLRRNIDFSNATVTIALSYILEYELDVFDKVLGE